MGLSGVGIAARTDLINGFGVGKACQDGGGVQYSPHGHSPADKVHVPLNPDAHSISAIDKLRFIKAQHYNCPSLRNSANRWHGEYRNLGVNGQGDQGNAPLRLIPYSLHESPTLQLIYALYDAKSTVFEVTRMEHVGSSFITIVGGVLHRWIAKSIRPSICAAQERRYDV